MRLHITLTLCAIAGVAALARAETPFTSDAPTPLVLAHAPEAGLARFSGKATLTGRYVFCRYGDADFSARFVPDAAGRRLLPHPVDAPPADAVHPDRPGAFLALVFAGRDLREVYGERFGAVRGRARVEIRDYHIGSECGGWTYGATFTRVALEGEPAFAEGDDGDPDGCQP